MSYDEYNMPGVMKNVIKRLSARQGVLGVVLVDPDGLTLDTNLDQIQAEMISGYVQVLIAKTNDAIRSVRNAGELVTITIELETKELLITPDTDGAFTIVILRQKD